MQLELLIVVVTILLVTSNGGILKKSPKGNAVNHPFKGFFNRFSKDKSPDPIDEVSFNLKSLNPWGKISKSVESLKQLLSDPKEMKRKWVEAKKEARICYDYVKEGDGIMGKVNNFVNVAVSHPRTTGTIILTWYLWNKVTEQDMKE